MRSTAAVAHIGNNIKTQELCERKWLTKLNSYHDYTGIGFRISIAEPGNDDLVLTATLCFGSSAPAAWHPQYHS